MNYAYFFRVGASIIMLPGLFVSCQDQNDAQPSGGDKVENSDSSKTTKADTVEIFDTSYYQDFACYYKMDDKYSEEEDTALIREWLVQKQAASADGKLPPALFTNGGPGPNGAEWNPSTDLYCIAALKDTVKIAKMEVRLNNKLSRKIQPGTSQHASEKLTFVQFVIPYPTWTENQRPLLESEIEEVSGDAYQYPDAGTQVLQITLAVFFEDGSAKKFNEYFHTAYGE